ncbi:hypothetical protein [Ferruginibacter sp.]
MKKTTLLAAALIMFTVSFAQVQRKRAVAANDSTAAPATGASRGEKMKMMRELNLTKEQKGKLKEIRQSGQEKKQAIENDASLTPDQKQAKLKALKKEQAKSTMGILSDEQKQKMMQMRKDKKAGEEDEMQMDNN